MRIASALALFCAFIAQALPSYAQVSGEAVFKQRCASCHDSGNPRVPPREELKKLSVTSILRTMDFGVMNNVATRLRQDEREAVASYLGIAANLRQGRHFSLLVV